MRGERKISKLISEFTGCAVWRGDDFMFVLGGGVPGIQWTDGEDAVLNKIWAYRLMEDYGFKLTNQNVFIMSILHEVGHAMTVDKFSTKHWNDEFAKKEKISEEMTKENFFEKNQEYFLMPTEKAATDWAVDYYNNNKDEIRVWQHRLNCAVKHYEKVSGRQVFERF